MITRFDRGPRTRKLYALEEAAVGRIKAAATEHSQLRKLSDDEYWSTAVVQELAAVLDSFEPVIAHEAIAEYLTEHLVNASRREHAKKTIQRLVEFAKVE